MLTRLPFHSYGCAAFFFLWCAFASYFFYKYPKVSCSCPNLSALTDLPPSQYYTGTLLLVTGCGSMLVLEWLYNENPQVKADHPRYDSPPLRFGELAAVLLS